MESPCKLRRVPYAGRIPMVLALLCVAASQPVAGQSFTVRDLGTLPNGFVSTARGINDRGQVVGDSETNVLFQPHAFLFDNGKMVDLGTLPGADFSEALGINDHGKVVGFS